MASTRPFALAFAGIAALCGLDATVNALTLTYTVAYAVRRRYAFGTGFALAVWWWQGRPRLTRDMLPAHLLRGCLIAATAFLFFYATRRCRRPRPGASRHSPACWATSASSC